MIHDAWLQAGPARATRRDLVLEVRGLRGERAAAYRLQGCYVLECLSMADLDAPRATIAIEQLRLAFAAMTPEPR